VSCSPGNTNVFTQTQSGNATLIRGAKIDRLKPFYQGQVRGMENSFRGYAGLMMALATLVCMARSYIVVFPACANRASKFFRS
jgi:hypothetical protein